MLTFIVPVLHPRNSPQWSRTIDYLRQTAGSIANQRSPDWRAIVVANTEAELPALPTFVDVVRVELPPNLLYARSAGDRESVNEAVRLDKGRRVLAGMLHADGQGHYMVVDADDFVSDRLAGLVADNPETNGWYMPEGFLWPDHGRFVYRRSGFYRMCGTSHVIRADLYGLPAKPENASDSYVKRRLGSHIFLRDDLERADTPLAPLPFAGAVYRIGHAGAHSQSSGLIRTVFIKRKVLTSPRRLMDETRRMRLIDRDFRDEFFG